MELTKSELILMRWARKTEDREVLNFIQGYALKHDLLSLVRIAVRRKVELEDKKNEGKEQ